MIMTPIEMQWFKDVGPTAAVAIVAIIYIYRLTSSFLSTLTRFQENRTREFENYSEGTIALVGLAITMANRCQRGRSTKDITPQEIIETGQAATKASQDYRSRHNQ